MLLHTLAGIAWDPQIRGFLAFGVGVVVLVGSVYLLLVTNLGLRLGFTIAAAAIFGWLTIMGGIWWVYGNIGMLGEINHWEVQEVVYPGLENAALEEARRLDTSELPDPEALSDLTDEELAKVRPDLEATLDGWRLLPESNPSYGEAKATVDAYFGANPDASLGIETAADYVPVYSFERGGKERLPDNPSRLDRIVTKLKTTFVELKHPPRHAVIQVQPIIKQEAEPGKPPPTPTADPGEPVVSVIMQRDLGDRRFPGAMLTISSGIMFAVLCVQLHRRDERVAAARSMVPATTGS
ncbi:MAG: hypothetical protein ACT452_14455 [Microthrixaceae bacterium]